MFEQTRILVFKLWFMIYKVNRDTLIVIKNLNIIFMNQSNALNLL